MHFSRLCLPVLTLSLCLWWGGAAQAQVHSIGEIRTARDARIARAGVETAAVAGAALEEKDTVITGSSGSVGFVLNDNSVITLGPNSRMALDEYAFEPQDGKVSLIGNLLTGTLEYISGNISKISKDAAKFRTPYTTVAARGTRLLIRAQE